MGSAWFAEARSVGVAAVAKALGHEAKEQGAACSVYGCPSCGADRRHTKSSDKRGAVGVVHDGAGWVCFQCDAKGDALDFASLELTGEALNGNRRAAEVKAWFAETFPAVRYAVELDDKAWREGRNSEAAKEVAQRRDELRAENARRDAARLEVESQEADANAERASNTWAECVDVTAAADVAAYLRARGIPPELVASLGLARALPAKPQTELGQRWAAEGRRLVMPLVDVHGRLRELVGRLPALDVASEQKKSVVPRGAKTSGLLFANAWALSALVAGEWPSNDKARELYIREGEIDYLRTATRPGAETLGVVGVRSGSWKQEHADRIPRRSTVYVYTDNDGAGDQYAEGITNTLRARGSFAEITIKRARLGSDPTRPTEQATP